MKQRVTSYEDLEVYKLALDLQQRIFSFTQSFPKEERYALTDQIRRASRAMGANIAEAWAKRHYPAHFLSKLTDAGGEQNETRHWFETCQLCNYIDQSQYKQLIAQCHGIGAKLGAMMRNPESWNPSDHSTI